MTIINSKNNICELISFFSDLTKITKETGFVYKIKSKLLKQNDFRKAKENVFRALLKEPDCYVIFPENIVDIYKQSESWSRLSSCAWTVPVDVDYKTFSDSVLDLGGWVLCVGGKKIIDEAEISKFQLLKPKGLEQFLFYSRASLVITSFEDDIAWLVACAIPI